MDDLVDALVGDSSAEESGEYRITAEDNETWVLDGAFPFFEFVRFFDIEGVKDDPADFHTVAGFIGLELNRVPEVGDRIQWRGLSLEVLSMVEGRRVDKIRVSRLP
jgi:putative hemolysin